MSTPIPQPPTVPFLGNVTQIDREVTLKSHELLCKQYGEIYQVDLITRKTVLVSSYELLNELSDDKRFAKTVAGPLVQVRNGMGDGLFTAYPGEENWGLAHRLLMPAFSTANVRNMFDDMMDLASQLVLRWKRFGPNEIINPAEDMSKLTFDTITLCAMSFRLNSFYREEVHPFIQAMSDFLIESGLRSFRPALVQSLMLSSNAKYQADMKIMTDLCNELINERRKNPSEKEDLLNIMLYGKDPKTGRGLSDETIMHNLLTFLVAGHETTSATLTFVIYHLMKNPEAMRKVRAEIDSVVGDQPIQPTHLSKLPYITAVMREALRLNPPATMRVVEPLKDETIGGGKYAIPKGQRVAIIAHVAQKDPKVWGDDAEEFKPERMLDENFEKLPPNAWQPFGYGMRACIGRPFAWQEAIIAIVSMYQNFDIVPHDPSYRLVLKETLTIKPKNFFVHAIPRKRAAVPMTIPPSSTLVAAPKASEKKIDEVETTGPKHPLYVVYGSNTGTSQTFAQRIASAASGHGFKASLGTLDSIAERVPKDGPLIVVTASFEGEPADNAAHFVEWIQSLKASEFEGVKFAVYGCGNKDWVRTYQRIPKLVDEILAARGGTRLHERGAGDAQTVEFFEVFDAWEAALWVALAKEYKIESKAPDAGAAPAGVSLETLDLGTARASVLRQPDANLGRVTENKLLTSPNGPAKRHIEFELPENVTFHAGDYLTILPTNPPQDVRRVVSHFGLSPEQQVVLHSDSPTSLPVDTPISISALLSGYVELSQVATTRDLRILAAAENASPETKAALETLAASYADSVLAKRISILDLLEDHKDLKIPFETYLLMLPFMRVRQYSISASPLHDPRRPTLTVSVLDAPALSGRPGERFLGVGSTYLASLQPGDVVQLAVRASAAVFHPPADPAVPMVMFAAGSGLSPMRGFLQERAMQKRAGREVARSVLFFGCRAPTEDYLYADSDLKEWTELGVVEVRPAFSRASELSEGCKYVQDRVLHDRAIIDKAWAENAKFFTCGSAKVAQGIKKVLTRIIQENLSCSDEEAAAKFERATQGRYATDVFE